MSAVISVLTANACIIIIIHSTVEPTALPLLLFVCPHEPCTKSLIQVRPEWHSANVIPSLNCLTSTYHQQAAESNVNRNETL